jgi:hypothetical protein
MRDNPKALRWLKEGKKRKRDLPVRVLKVLTLRK